MGAPLAIVLGCQVLKRLAMSAGVIIVNAMSVWTDTYFGLVQGICIAVLIFIITKQMDQSTSIQPKLLKRVCLLYCNRQARKLFIINDSSPASIFSDITLAMILAVIAMVLHDEKNNPSSVRDLKQMLESLLYLYGDILDFVFQYGVLKITICAFGVSIFLRTTAQPTGKMSAFCCRMASIISANLLSQGMTELIPTSTSELQLVQCLASVCILRLILPEMQSYLTFLAAQQLMKIVPGVAPLFACITVCLDVLPPSGQEWIGELCFTYVISSIIAETTVFPFWGMLLLLIMAHYVDFIVHSLGID